MAAQLLKQHTALLGNGRDWPDADDYRRALTELFEAGDAVRQQALTIFELYILVQKSGQQVEHHQWFAWGRARNRLEHCQHLDAREGA